MALKIEAKFEGKHTCAFQNDTRNMAHFHQNTWKISKLGLWWDPFIRSRKCMSLKFTEELCVMTMKNEAKFKEELKNFQVNHGQRDSIIFPQTFSVESSKQLLDLCLAESRILYFWQVLESIHKLIIELHVQPPPSLPLFFAVTAFFLQSVWRTTNCVIRSWTDH